MKMMMHIDPHNFVYDHNNKGKEKTVDNYMEVKHFV